MQRERALWSNRQLIDTLELERDRSWIGLGCNDEVVLQLMLCAIKEHIDARIDRLVSDAGKCLRIDNVLRRIVAEKIIGPAGERLQSRRYG